MAANQNFESLSKRARLDIDTDESQSKLNVIHHDVHALENAPIGVYATGSHLRHVSVKVPESPEPEGHKAKTVSKLDEENKQKTGEASTGQHTIPQSLSMDMADRNNAAESLSMDIADRNKVAESSSMDMADRNKVAESSSMDMADRNKVAESSSMDMADQNKVAQSSTEENRAGKSSTEWQKAGQSSMGRNNMSDSSMPSSAVRASSSLSSGAELSCISVDEVRQDMSTVSRHSPHSPAQDSVAVVVTQSCSLAQDSGTVVVAQSCSQSPDQDSGMVVVAQIRSQSPDRDSGTLVIKLASPGADVTSTRASAAPDSGDDESDNISDISNLSGAGTEESWKPTSGPMSWIQEQMMTGQDPRNVLHELISSGVNIPEQLDDITLWKIIINLLTEPPRRRKLKTVNTLDDVVSLIQRSSKIMVLTGAGVSVSCGIPDFRSRDGIYARLSVDFPDLPDPQAMFDISYFIHDQRPFFKFAKEIYPGQFKPSKCHEFIQLIESEGRLLRNYTQNIDTLEQVAGIKNVVQCHGSFATATCMACKHKMDADAIREDIFNQTIPRCPVCTKDTVLAVMKPDIVFFGEGLSQEFHRQMAADKNDCDLLIIIGSSLKVRPVALIPSSLPAEVPQILINREPLPHLTFDVQLFGNCDVIIDELCRRLGSPWSRLSSSPSSALHQVRRDELATPPLPEITTPPVPELATPPLPELMTQPLPEPFLSGTSHASPTDHHRSDIEHSITSHHQSHRVKHLPNRDTDSNHSSSSQNSGLLNKYDSSRVPHSVCPDVDRECLESAEGLGVSASDQVIESHDREDGLKTACHGSREQCQTGQADRASTVDNVCRTADQVLSTASRDATTTAISVATTNEASVGTSSHSITTTICDVASTLNAQCVQSGNGLSVLDDVAMTDDDVPMTDHAVPMTDHDVPMTDHDVRVSVQRTVSSMPYTSNAMSVQDVKTVSFIQHTSNAKNTTVLDIVDDSSKEQTSEQKVSLKTHHHHHHHHHHHGSHSLGSECKSESMARQYIEHSTNSASEHQPCAQNIADHGRNDLPDLESRHVLASADTHHSSSKAGLQLPIIADVGVDVAQLGDVSDGESSIVLSRELSGGSPRAAAVPIRERCSISLDPDAIQQMWHSPNKHSLAAQLQDNEYLFLPPHRYIFHGAEVYSSFSDDSDSESDDSSSVDSENSASDDSGLDMHGVKITVNTYRENEPQSTGTHEINGDATQRVSVKRRTGVETDVEREKEAHLEGDLCERNNEASLKQK